MANEQEFVFEFDKVVFGGYDAEQVEEYAVGMEQSVASLKKENAALSQKLRILAAKIEEYRAGGVAAPQEIASQEVAPAQEEALREQTALLQGKETRLQEQETRLQNQAAGLRERETRLQEQEARLQEKEAHLQKQAAGLPVEKTEQPDWAGLLEAAKAALAEQTARAERAEKALASRREDELGFCREVMEKYQARQAALTGQSVAPVLPSLSEPARPAVRVISFEAEKARKDQLAAEAARPAVSSQPAEIVKEKADLPADTLVKNTRDKNIIAQADEASLAKATESCPLPLTPEDQQTYEECLARVLQQEAKEANLKPGESKVVSLRAPETARRPEAAHLPENRVRPRENAASASARDNLRPAERPSAARPAAGDDAPRRGNPAPPAKKKKPGLMDFVKESVLRALNDDEDEDDDEGDTLQFGKAYDVKKRK